MTPTTFDALDTDTGELTRGRIDATPAPLRSALTRGQAERQGSPHLRCALYEAALSACRLRSRGAASNPACQPVPRLANGISHARSSSRDFRQESDLGRAYRLR